MSKTLAVHSDIFYYKFQSVTMKIVFFQNSLYDKIYYK